MKRESKDYEELIYDYLTNPGRYDHFSFHDELYLKNLDVVFNTLLDEANPSTPTECAAYLFGKSCEVAILTKCRPGFKRIYVAPEEVTTSINLNLPAHLEDIVIDMLDGCENAVEKFISEENPDVKQLLLDVQHIAEKICKDDYIADEEAASLSNNDVAFPTEAYVFANNAVLKELQGSGYKVLGVSENRTNAVSCILESPTGEKMFVLEQVTVSPRTAKFLPFYKEACKKAADKENAKAYMLGIMLESENEAEKNAGVITKGGKTIIRRTDFLPI